ncbi:MAG: GFA family protein [Rhizobiales bacterium]|nr:GFA family protein [Hyphomicrobiales bacterium]
MTAVLTGGCQCGAVSYSAAAQPQGYACHCLDCQKQSSSAFGISIPMDAADLSVEGPLECFIKTADSGAQTDCFFCSHCGSRIYHEGKSRPGKVTVKGGTLDDTSKLVLTGHVWVSRKQPWLDLDPDLPAWETQPASPEEWELLWSGGR